MKHSELVDADCAIAQALGVVGDWWTLLVIRDIAGGITRFDDLQRELDVSRKTLTDRLRLLVDHGVVERRAYSDRPPRHDYVLTDTGRGLLPVLIALQDWGARYVLGDGSLTGSSAPESREARRVHDLVGQSIPALRLASQDERDVDPIAADGFTVLFCFPGAFAPGQAGYPPGWSDIPGTAGCTLEALTYRDRTEAFADVGAEIRGVSTQRPDQLAAFATHAALSYSLLSDADSQLAAALRLPTFRVAGLDRLKRTTLIVDAERTIRAVQFPVTDPAGSVDEALTALRSL